ncbi:MAG: CHAT domain-containing protein [Candidatus Aminicenantes bacterium]|nr:CHAT domain-containing protein [Candidatus Aminicenantes bacterium]
MKRHVFFAPILLIFLLFPLVLHPRASCPPQTAPTQAAPRYNELFAQGEKLRLSGEFEKALALFKDSAALAARDNSKKGETEARLKIGLLFWNLGRLKESEAAYRDALALAKAAGIDPARKTAADALEIADHYAKAKDLIDRDNYSQSIETFKKAIALAEATGSPDHSLKCIRQMSRAYWYLTDYPEFQRLNETALGIARAIRNKKDEGICLNNIGAYHLKIADYSKALAYFDQALSIARAVKNPQSENESLNNMGIAYQEIGDYDRALATLNAALLLDQQAFGRDYTAIHLNNIGIVYRKKGLLSGSAEDFRKALEYFRKALDLIDVERAKKTAVNILNDIGTVHSDMGNPSKALVYFERALRIAESVSDKEGISLTANNLGIVHYALGDYDKAAEYSRRAIDIAVQIQTGHVLWEALLELANSAAKQGRLDEALSYYKDSISVIESARSSLDLEELKASYLGTDKRIEAYHNIIDVLVRLHRTDPTKNYDAQAFFYLEKAKARAFLDSLEVAQVPVLQGIDNRLVREEKRLIKELNDLYKNLLELNLTPAQKADLSKKLGAREDDYEKLKREIRSSSPAYAGLKYPEVIPLIEARKTLAAAGTTFISYAVGKDSSYGFALDNKGLKIFPIPARKELQAKVSAYLKVVSDKDASDFRLGRELFAELVRPGLDPAAKRLVFIPDDILHFLPFETLRRGDGRETWLIEDYAVAYAPSLSSLREIIRRAGQRGLRPKKDLLAFGDPDYGPAALNPASPGAPSADAAASAVTPSPATTAPSAVPPSPPDVFQNFYASTAFRFFPLKFSGTEVRRIAALFRPRRADVFLKGQASEKTLQSAPLDDYKIIHFAAHGLIDDQRPARSSIVLSLDPAAPEDGFVQVREIYNLKMRASLVGLSACQTGLGRFVRGEGIEGLNRAFFYAGASSVLMTLWSVNDEAGSQLVERFYRRLRAADPIMDALRAAKLDLVRSPAFSHPYYWAGYVITGDAAKVILPKKTPFWIFALIALCLAGIIRIFLSPRTGLSSSEGKKGRSTTEKRRR